MVHESKLSKHTAIRVVKHLLLPGAITGIFQYIKFPMNDNIELISLFVDELMDGI